MQRRTYIANKDRISPNAYQYLCSRIVNKVPSPFSLSLPSRFWVTRIFGRSSRVCTLKMGKRHGALPRRDNKGRKVPSTSRLTISGIHKRDSAFRRFARRPYVPTRCATSYRYIGARSLRGGVYRARFSPPWNPAFRDTTLLWSAQLSCVQMSGFRVRDGLLAHTVRKPIRHWAPSLFPLRCAFFLRPWLPPPRARSPFSLTGSLEAH